MRVRGDGELTTDAGEATRDDRDQMITSSKTVAFEDSYCVYIRYI